MSPELTSSSSSSAATRKPYAKAGRCAKSCDICHARKTRCSGTRPCAFCERRGKASECTYSEIQPANAAALKASKGGAYEIDQHKSIESTTGTGGNSNAGSSSTATSSSKKRRRSGTSTTIVPTANANANANAVVHRSQHNELGECQREETTQSSSSSSSRPPSQLASLLLSPANQLGISLSLPPNPTHTPSPNFGSVNLPRQPFGVDIMNGNNDRSISGLPTIAARHRHDSIAGESGFSPSLSSNTSLPFTSPPAKIQQLHSTSHGPKHAGPSSGSSSAAAAAAATHDDDHSLSGSLLSRFQRTSDGEIDNFVEPDLTKLIDRRTSLKYFDAYFSEAEWLYQLHTNVELTSAQHEAIWSECIEGRHSNTTPSTPLPTGTRTIIIALLAIGALFSNSLSDSELLYRVARSSYLTILDLVTLESISLSMHLAVFEINTSRSRSLWSSLSSAVRLAHALNLHRAPALRGRNEAERKRRTQLWWNAFVHDVWLSLSTGRPCIVSGEDCDIPRPWEPHLVRLQQSSENDEMDGMLVGNGIFAMRVKLSFIWTKIHHRLYTSNDSSGPHGAHWLSALTELEAELQDWIRDMELLSQQPQYNNRSDKKQCQAVLLACAIVRIIMHRSYLIQPDPSPSSSSLPTSASSNSRTDDDIDPRLYRAFLQQRRISEAAVLDGVLAVLSTSQKLVRLGMHLLYWFLISNLQIACLALCEYMQNCALRQQQQQHSRTVQRPRREYCPGRGRGRGQIGMEEAMVEQGEDEKEEEEEEEVDLLKRPQEALAVAIELLEEIERSGENPVAGQVLEAVKAIRDVWLTGVSSSSGQNQNHQHSYVHQQQQQQQRQRSQQRQPHPASSSQQQSVPPAAAAAHDGSATTSTPNMLDNSSGASSIKYHQYPQDMIPTDILDASPASLAFHPPSPLPVATTPTDRPDFSTTAGQAQGQMSSSSSCTFPSDRSTGTGTSTTLLFNKDHHHHQISLPTFNSLFETEHTNGISLHADGHGHGVGSGNGNGSGSGIMPDNNNNTNMMLNSEHNSSHPIDDDVSVPIADPDTLPNELGHNSSSNINNINNISGELDWLSALTTSNIFDGFVETNPPAGESMAWWLGPYM